MGEMAILVEDLVTGDHPVASVTKSSKVRLSHGEHWGALGSWDKIPYTVEVVGSVTLNCDQTTRMINIANSVAEDISVGGVKDHLGRLLVTHSEDIRSRLFPHIFEENDG